MEQEASKYAQSGATILWRSEYGLLPTGIKMACLLTELITMECIRQKIAGGLTIKPRAITGEQMFILLTKGKHIQLRNGLKELA